MTRSGGEEEHGGEECGGEEERGGEEVRGSTAGRTEEDPAPCRDFFPSYTLEQNRPCTDIPTLRLLPRRTTASWRRSSAVCGNEQVWAEPRSR